jgi:aspartyl-tRNA(Asn)/glutamyl-tRNA(Gln) amidotransferase subunit A
MELKDFTILDINNGLKKKNFSCFEICKLYFERIEKEDKKIFSFLTLNIENALSDARKIDEKISKLSPSELDLLPFLTGVPFAVKDNILVENLRCTAGSKMLENYIAPYDATVIKKLKEVGAIVIGKTNLDEFAMGSSTENSFFGPTRNPLDLNRVPGGSSGGSAAAVAANLCVFSLGSDTGGSIRQPASFCGVVGLKPTYGSVSRYGLIAFASSLDQIGPITKNVEDAKIIFEIIKGKDPFDATSLEYMSDVNNKEIKDVVIGIPKNYFVKGIDKNVENVIRDAIKKYENLGCTFLEIDLPHTEYALPCYYIIAPSEASSNLARYDGIRYGYSKSFNEYDNLFDYYLKSRGEGFGKEVRRRIMIGTYSLSSGYYDAYYLKAQKVRAKIKQDFDEAFKVVDFIFTPVSPTTAFLLGERVNNPISMYLADIFTVAVSLSGLPALSIPVGYVNNLPVGLQIIGKPFQEYEIFRIAKMYDNL